MNVISTPKFKDDIKYYMKKKRYLKINDDVSTVTDELENGNLIGDKLEDLDIPEGTAAYKVRIANSSAGVNPTGSDFFITWRLATTFIYFPFTQKKMIFA